MMVEGVRVRSGVLGVIPLGLELAGLRQNHDTVDCCIVHA